MKRSFAFVAATLVVILLAPAAPSQDRRDVGGRRRDDDSGGRGRGGAGGVRVQGGGERGGPPGGATRGGFGGGQPGGITRGGSGGGQPGGGTRSGFGGGPPGGGDRSRGGFGGGQPGGGDRSRGGQPGGGDRSRGGFGGGPPGGGDRGGRPTLDSNGDGRIDQNEINQMSDQMKQIMKSRGITIRPGMSMDDFRNNMREQFSRGGDSQARNGVLTPFRPRTKERMTVDLPPKYSELDIDYDGQIGLYEWITARRESLSQFDEMDMNFDGILTPSELLVYDEVMASGKPQVTSYIRERVTIVGGGRSTRSTGSAAIRLGGSAKTARPSTEEVQKHAATAKRYFTAMDKNKDGKIGEDEWAQSRRLKPWFEKAGIKLTTMSESDFAGKFAIAMKSVGK
ncbi:MAG: hypothetical protein GY903_06150 [Fuerstiella sp.]|nr:hypothetical protein [Fuerstiella sp.]MCP4854057.1 hypothetical protein [Fuerstiella sp.]